MVELLRRAGHQVYDFRHPTEAFENPNGLAHGFHWSDIDPNWEQWSAEKYLSDLKTHPLAAQGFESDWYAMEWADTCVLVLPSGRSSHLEAGYFVGRPGKELHIYLPVTTKIGPDLMYLMANSINTRWSLVMAALDHSIV